MPIEIIKGFRDVGLLKNLALPYDNLDPGDAFKVPYEDPDRLKQRSRLNARNQAMQSRTGKRFSLRAGDDGFYIIRKA